MQHINKIISLCKCSGTCITTNSSVNNIKRFSQFCRNMSSLSYKKKKPGTFLDPMGMFLLSIPVGAFCLGTWQIRRRQWKLKLIESLQQKMNANPVPLPDNLEEMSDVEYIKVSLSGRFIHDKEMYIGPRSLIESEDKEKQKTGFMSSTQSGFLVITPFKLEDRDKTVLVNRGWVSRKQRDPERRQVGQVEGVVHLTGIVRKHEDRPQFGPRHLTQKEFLYRDVNSMSALSKTSPIFVDAVETLSEEGPIGAQTRVTMRNEHLSYIFTWYALTAATTYLWHKRYILGKSLM